MKTIILGRQMNVWNDFKLLIENKLEKLDKYFAEEAEATVTLSKKRNLRNIEVTILAGGTIFRSEVAKEDFRCALDEALETIERQIRKNKTRLSKMLRTGILDEDPAFDDGSPEDYGFDEEEDEGYTLKVKKFAFKPMTVEEAIMQMELIGHQFFVYNDAETNETCVVYKRHDNGYGLIVPDDGIDE
jgi:putative sigma-54 modulation protein